MTSMIFYEKPVALNRERHRRLKLHQQAGQFEFARATNSTLMAAVEINEAARDYPVVFVANPAGQYVLACLLGLHDRENLFVDEAGRWRANHYVPAFVRRYPFVLAENNDSQLTVCVDESFSGLNETEGEPLFDDAGEDSALLRNAVDFLKRFHAQMQYSRAFAERLVELDLLVPKVIRVSRDGRQETLDGLHVVDEQKLRGLDDARALDLFRSGYLAWIHAHLNSLGNVQRLAAMEAAAAGQTGASASGAAAGQTPDVSDEHASV